jgi:conflict system pore-forming effector with SLATT domain
LIFAVENQIAWYTDKAGAHHRLANVWLWASAAASCLGVVAAILRMLGVIDLDLLGVAAACASAAIAWNQLNQNRNLVSAYRMTARELSIIRDRIDLVDDADWAVFVSDAEDAVSREHTMWLARHGHPGFRTR